MKWKNKSVIILYLILCFVIIPGFTGACRSPKQLVGEADQEAYQIIENKWQGDFGQMANYKIRDSVPAEEEINSLIPPSRVITLNQAVAIATQFNRDYQSRKETLYLSALDLTLTRHEYARQWFGTFDGQYYSSGGIENNTLSSEAGVDQAFITAGGIIANAGLSIDWTRFLSGDPYTTLGSVLAANITAPLLGRGGGKTAWENLTQAERNVLYQIRSFNRYRKEFVVDIIRNYYNVLEQMNSLDVIRASYERQIDTTNQLKMQVEVGQLAPSEVFEAQQQLLSAENSVVFAQQRYAQTLDNFKVRLSLPTNADITLDPNELKALEDMEINLPEYTVEDAIAMALEHRLDLANTRDGLDDTERKLILAAEGLGVQLNLIGSAGVESTEKTDFTRLRFHEGTYSLGFETDLPFDRKAERNAYREALISVVQRQRGYDQEVENIELAVRQAYRDMEETTKSYQIQKLSVALAERRVEEQRLRLETGTGIIRLLVNSENALVLAQNELTSALVAYINAKMSFFRDIGILEVRPDGMWEQRAQ